MGVWDNDNQVRFEGLGYLEGLEVVSEPDAERIGIQLRDLQGSCRLRNSVAHGRHVAVPEEDGGVPSCSPTYLVRPRISIELIQIRLSPL